LGFVPNDGGETSQIPADNDLTYIDHPDKIELSCGADIGTFPALCFYAERNGK
jgi:hypothetical protein